jgi:hypothetical protein
MGSSFHIVEPDGLFEGVEAIKDSRTAPPSLQDIVRGEPFQTQGETTSCLS